VVTSDGNAMRSRSVHLQLPSVCELQKKEQVGQGSSEGQIGVVGFLERGQLAPASLARGLGSATSAINGVPGEALADQRFFSVL